MVLTKIYKRVCVCLCICVFVFVYVCVWCLISPSRRLWSPPEHSTSSEHTASWHKHTHAHTSRPTQQPHTTLILALTHLRIHAPEASRKTAERETDRAGEWGQTTRKRGGDFRYREEKEGEDEGVIQFKSQKEDADATGINRGRQQHMKKWKNRFRFNT